MVGFAYGLARPNAVDVALAEISRWPGGASVLIQDEKQTRWTGAAGEVQAAGQMVALHGVAGVAGHADSRSALLAAPIYDEAHVPLVVPNATSHRLRSVSPWVFPLAPDDSTEAAFIVRFAIGTLSARRVALLYDNDAYGLGLRDGVRLALVAQGGSVTTEAPIGLVCAAAPDNTGTDPAIALVTRRENRPDVVVIAGRTRDAACIVRQVSAHLPSIRFIASEAVEVDEAFLHMIGAAADSFYLVALWYATLPDARSIAFVQEFRRIVGRPPTAAEAMQYDALLLLAHAVREAGGKPAAVRAYLAGLGTTRPPYDGITGPVGFNPGRRRPLYMLRLRRGELVPMTVR